MSAILHVFTIHHGILHGMGRQMVVRLLLTIELLVTLSAAERFITRFRGLVNLNYTQIQGIFVSSLFKRVILVLVGSSCHTLMAAEAWMSLQARTL